MKSTIVVMALLLIGAGQAFGQVERTDVVGLWLSEEKDGKVEIFEKEDGTFAGITRWVLVDGKVNPPAKDVNNEDASKRDRPILGLEMMHGFRYKDGKWKDGRIYDPRNGKEYHAYMYFKKGDKNTLYFRGYIGIPLLGQTTIWTRIKE